MSEIWSTTITRVGSDAADMLAAGCYILFAEPVPDALAEVSIVHDRSGVEVTIEPGDQFWIGDDAFDVVEVGERASGNLSELGHVVLYANNPEQRLLPGAVKVTGEPSVPPSAGASMRITRGA